MNIKYFLITAVLATAFLFFGATGVNAVSVSCESFAGTSYQIECLTNQIAQLMQQLKALQAQQNTNTTWCHSFNNNLKIGDGGMGGGGRSPNAIDNDVVAIKQALAKEGIYNLEIDQPGTAGSSIKATVFHEQLAAAVVAFQEKYASEILTPNGLQHGTGFVGSSTRAKLNALYGCSNGTKKCFGESEKLSGCPRLYSPVCGKNGKTYDNCCFAEQSGTEIAHTGTCTTNQKITVISPNGGETLKVGERYNIKWDSTGLPPDSGVYIGINGADGTSNLSGAQIAHVLAYPGKYSWLVPSIMGESLSGKKYNVYVTFDSSTSSNYVGDTSDKSFSVTGNCASEGESIPVIANPPVCCAGLTLIKPKFSDLVGSAGFCTAKCGDKVCNSETETHYNCPQDCI